MKKMNQYTLFISVDLLEVDFKPNSIP